LRVASQRAVKRFLLAVQNIKAHLQISRFGREAGGHSVNVFVEKGGQHVAAIGADDEAKVAGLGEIPPCPVAVR
jgi:hypothetical protein